MLDKEIYWTLIFFQTLAVAQELKEEWMMMYNGQRPHEALGNLTPYEYALAAGT
jgi:putative transposase